jgi:predicted RNase H-like HicB family nuclease
MEYVVIVEQGNTSFGAYVPDLPGCVAVADTRDEAMELIRDAIAMHIESLRENGEPVPHCTRSSRRSLCSVHESSEASVPEKNACGARLRISFLAIG